MLPGLWTSVRHLLTSASLTPVTCNTGVSTRKNYWRQKLSIEFCIDWLHVNEPYKAYSLLGSHLYKHPTKARLSPATPRHGYTEGIRNQAGAIAMRNRNRSDMGVHVSYSGSTLNDYREHDISSLNILRWHIARQASVSRIDLAFDVKHESLNPRELYAMLDGGQATTTAKTWNLITGNDGGATCYIGSRQSEAFVRIYDKAAQTGTDGQWTRIELELKASKARFAAFTMASGEDEHAFSWAQSWLQGFVSFPHDVWRKIMVEEAIPLARANKPEKDTRKWLMDTCAPAMARYMNETGDFALLADFMAVLAAYEDKSALA